MTTPMMWQPPLDGAKRRLTEPSALMTPTERPPCSLPDDGGACGRQPKEDYAAVVVRVAQTASPVNGADESPPAHKPCVR